MTKERTVPALALMLLLIFVPSMAETTDQAVPVESKSVCMINDRSMTTEQIPIEIDGKTYFGCCPMCKERLAKEPSTRQAIDPVSGKVVDKATATIGALPGAAVLYFENGENLRKYNAGKRAQQK